MSEELKQRWEDCKRSAQIHGPSMTWGEFLSAHPWAWPMWNDAYSSNKSRATPPSPSTAEPWGYALFRNGKQVGVERTKRQADSWVDAVAVPLGPLGPMQSPNTASEVGELRAALRAVNAVAIERGDKFGACDQIDNEGKPYQSQWFSSLLSGAALAAKTAESKAVKLLREARATLEMWKDVAPAVSLCADIDTALADMPTSNQEAPDWLKYDAVSDVLEIHGIKYAQELFIDFAKALPVGQVLKFVSREDGVIRLNRLDAQPSTGEVNVEAERKLPDRIQSALDLLADATLPRDTWRDVSNVLHACRDALAASRTQAEGAKDTERLDFVVANTDKTLRCHKKGWLYHGFTNYAVEAFKTPREAIDAAIAATQKGE